MAWRCYGIWYGSWHDKDMAWFYDDGIILPRQSNSEQWSSIFRYTQTFLSQLIRCIHNILELFSKSLQIIIVRAMFYVVATIKNGFGWQAWPPIHSKFVLCIFFWFSASRAFFWYPTWLVLMELWTHHVPRHKKCARPICARDYAAAATPIMLDFFLVILDTH